jgi:competence protein ComEA
VPALLAPVHIHGDEAMKRTLFALAALLFSAVAAAAIDVNTATKDELVALPGIGPAKAQAIVDYRSQHGPFKSVDEVRKVKGIGDKLFQQIRPELSVGGPSPKSVAQASAKGEAKAEAKPAARQTTGPIAKEAAAKK